MRNWLVAFAVATSMMCGSAGAQQTDPGAAAELPSRLDSFLTANPGATRTTKFLRSLTGVGDVWDTETNLVRQAQVTAIFTAMSASLQRDSTIRQKGLEVRIEYLGNHGEQRLLRRMYIDEDIFDQFDDELGRLLQLERDWQHQHPLGYRTESEHPPCWISPVNLSSAPEDQGDDSRRRKPLSAGWYWKIDPAGDEPVGRVCLQVDGEYYFPETKLEQLIEIVAKGRAFLAAN
jgi:hypothetical protein